MQQHLAFSAGKIHFIGIGGIGMSGIAEVLHGLGYQVSGSDLVENSNVERLRRLNISIYIGHDASHIDLAAIVVVSSDVRSNNVEIIAAKARHLPVIRRAEMLAELMRFKSSIAIAGTHGKTTTTSLCAALLEAAHLDPTVVNGGIINAYGTNARLGSGSWMVVEADESDGSFLKLPATIAVVTNIDPEHMSYYGTFNELKEAFKQFIHNIPFYGLSILCSDHPVVRELALEITDRRVITYGLEKGADIQAINVRFEENHMVFDVISPSTSHNQSFASLYKLSTMERLDLKDLSLSMVGDHNVQNALVTLAIARELGLTEPAVRKALANFSGVKRRFTKIGEAKGITIIDDYAHHPVEITAVLKAARKVCSKRLIVVVQPHRYSRWVELFSDFCNCLQEADTVIIAPIFSAGEVPMPTLTQESILAGVIEKGHPHARLLKGEDQLASMIVEIAHPGDYVLCLGAGSITYWAQKLPARINALQILEKDKNL